MIERVELDLQQFGLTVTNSSFCYGLRAGNKGLQEMFSEFRTFVACEQQKPFTIATPATWWDHFKQRFFPHWLTRRFPVQLQTHEIAIKTVYPFLKTKLPLRMTGSRVIVLANERPIGGFLPQSNGIAVDEQYAPAEAFQKKFAVADKCPMCRRALVERP